ncbi:hypothetical protein HK096_006763, partial [Nowakowskiella sp. JEL0078]
MKVFNIILAASLVLPSVLAVPVPGKNDFLAGRAIHATDVAFKDIDISQQNTDGAGTLANAKKVCTSTDSADTLKAKGASAENAELTFFNQAVAAASGDAKKAIQCQKDRNKVLKNFCELLEAQLTKNQAQITLNTNQVAKNQQTVDTSCAGVNTALFIKPDATTGIVSGAAGSGSTKTTTTAAAKAKTTKAKKTKSKKAKTTTTDAAAATDAAVNRRSDEDNEDDEEEVSIKRRAVHATDVAFKDIDISTKNTGGAATLANAKLVCPDSDSAATLTAKSASAENAEILFFNPAIDAATGDAKKAIQCQKDRNKVLKNFCESLEAQKSGNTAQLTKNNAQVANNQKTVDTACAGVNAALFIQPDANTGIVSGSASTKTKSVKAKKTTKTKKAKATPTAAARRSIQEEISVERRAIHATDVAFKDIDISQQNTDGAGTLANAKKVCTSTDSADTLKAKGASAENAELTFFNQA